MTASLYQSLVSTSSLLSGIEGFEVFDESAINAEVNGEAMSLADRIQPIVDVIARSELSQVSVPLVYAPEYFGSHMDDYQHFRQAYRACRLIANVAAFHGDYALVASNGMLILDLANAVRRGGLVVDHLVSLTIAWGGVNCLRAARAEFADDVRRDLIASLERYATQREPLSEIAERDAKWEAECGFKGAGADPQFEDLTNEDLGLSLEERRAVFAYVKKFHQQPPSTQGSVHFDQEHHSLALTRMLTIDLALRCWRDGHGCFPKLVGEVSPNLLATVPRDPFTEADFVYRPFELSFTLYSTGPDKTDCGGNFAPWCHVAAGGYDLSLDSEDYQHVRRTLPVGPGLLRRLWSRILNRS